MSTTPTLLMGYGTLYVTSNLWLFQVSCERRTTSCFYHLHCTVFIRSYCSLFAARLSQHISAYSLVVQYCSESSRHRYRKMKMTEIWQKLHCIKKSISNLSLCVWQLQMLTRALQTKLYRLDGDSFSCLINCGSTLILHSTYNWTVQSKPDSTVQQNKKR